MYTAIRKYYIIPGTVEECMRRVQEGFVPLISHVPGFQAYFALKVREDEAVAISILNTQAGAEESLRRAAVWVANNQDTLNQGLPEITVGHVSVHQGVYSNRTMTND